MITVVVFSNAGATAGGGPSLVLLVTTVVSSVPGVCGDTAGVSAGNGGASVRLRRD